MTFSHTRSAGASISTTESTSCAFVSGRFLESNVALRGLNEALEDQSRRTARLIHDGAGQILFSLQLALAELMTSLPAQWKPQLDQTMQLADHLDQQLRGLSRDLYPVALDDLGLNAAVSHLLDGVSTRAGLKVSLRSSVPDQLPPQIGIGLYRALHECITNVVRHANATELDVAMEVVADDDVRPDHALHEQRENGCDIGGILSARRRAEQLRRK